MKKIFRKATWLRQGKMTLSAYRFLAFAILVLIMVTVVVNRWIMGLVGFNQEDRSLSVKFEPKVVQHELVPAEPEQYRLTASDPFDFSLTQRDWDSRIGQVLNKSDLPSRPTLSAKEYQQKLQMVNRRIKQTERIVRTRANDLKAKQDLQTLYMLKATLVHAGFREETMPAVKRKKGK